MTSYRRLLRGSLAVALLVTLAGCSMGRATVLAGPEAGLRQPVGIALLPGAGGDGAVLVTDSGNNRIVKFDADGRVLAVWGEQGDAPGQFSRPLGLAIAPDRQVYVADYLNDRVQVLDAVGRPLASWHHFGDGDQFHGPADVAVDAKGNVYVIEFNGSRVIKLDHAGKLIKTWAGEGHDDGQLYYPTRLTIGPDGRVWVTDAYNHRLVIYSTDGERLRAVGGHGKKPGQFDVAGGVAFDNAGGMWAADFFNNRLQRFADAAGDQTPVTTWNGKHTGIGPLRQPTDLVFDPARGVLTIVDFGNDRLVTLMLDQR